MKNKAQTEFNFYPNPIPEKLFVHSTEVEKARICIYGLTGRLFLNQDIRTRHVINDFTSNNGFYSVEKEGIVTQKLEHFRR